MKPIVEYSKFTIVIALLVVLIIGAIVVSKMNSHYKHAAQTNVQCYANLVASGIPSMDATSYCSLP